MTTTTPMTLLDHVGAYAAAVRAALADLPPEQVEDLTDGLEADLAEALEDREGPVVTGETPIGRTTAHGAATTPGSSAMIDLTRRFGPAADYAAELRAAAGLALPQHGRGLRAPWRLRLAAVPAAVERVRRARREFVDGLRGATTTGPVLRLVEAFAPLWWLARAWSWWVLVVAFVSPYRWPRIDQYIPRGFWDWALLAALVALSVAYGRGWGTGRWWTAGLLGLAGLVAVVNLAGAVPLFADELRAAGWTGAPSVQYVEVPAEAAAPEPQDGVWVDGIQVSNLFVYDAEGEALQGVQIFDDRGRPVRTTFDGGVLSWALPGVSEPWMFAPALDADGRSRWNVYPLVGAPASVWDLGSMGGPPEFADGYELRVPPAPFAKAPAVTVGSVPED